jgi:hypothetical protein
VIVVSVDGSEAKIVSGIDDYCRFCVSAHVVVRGNGPPDVWLPSTALQISMPITGWVGGVRAGQQSVGLRRP